MRGRLRHPHARPVFAAVGETAAGEGICLAGEVCVLQAAGRGAGFHPRRQRADGAEFVSRGRIHVVVSAPLTAVCDHVNQNGNTDEENSEANDDNNGVDSAGFFRNTRSLCFLGVHGTSKMPFKSGGDGFLVLELNGKPLFLEALPFFRQSREGFGG